MFSICLIRSLLYSQTYCQDRYWGSYSSTYPAGGGGDSTNVAFAVANEQEVSRQFLAASRSSPEITSPALNVPNTQDLKTTRPSGYSHDPTGDTGLPYIHDPTGDFGPYKLYKWRQQQKQEADEAKNEVTLPDPISAPRKKIVAVRKQKVKTVPLQPIRPAFESFPSRQEQQQQPRAEPARQQQRAQPIRQQQRVQRVRQQQTVLRQPETVVPAINNPQPLTPKREPQTPLFISQATGLSPQSSFAQRSYSYTAPTYNAQAQGVSFSYEALF